MWGEVWRLVQQLLADPTSRLLAASAEWDRPISIEALMVADLFDLTALVHSGKKKKPKPHPIRPWKPGKKRIEKPADITGRTREEVVEILAAAKAGKL